MRDYSDIINIKRPPLKHPRMTLENRAKAYAPFDALRGFSLAILAKQAERELTTPLILSEDAKEQLNHKLSCLDEGTKVTVKYFRIEKRIGDLEIGTYIQETGPIVSLDIENHALLLPQCYISVEDIIELESTAFNSEFADFPEVEPYAG